MFDGFSAQDFDAYLPDKWGSNMFTLPRRRVRDKLDALSRHLAPMLGSCGIGARAHLSDDHPSLWNKKRVDTQWLFFARDEAAERDIAEVIDLEKTLAATLADPTPLFRHAFLGAAVRVDRLDVGIWLHHDAWVDRRNLLALLADADGRARFEALRAGLPEEIGIGLAEGELSPAKDLVPERLDGLLREFEEKKGWMFAGARLPRDAVIALGADALATVSALFSRLVPLYAFAAWSKTNDAISIDGVVSERRCALRAAEEEIERERCEREARRREEDERRRKLREETEERARAEQEWRERERAIRRAATTRVEAQPEAPAAAPAERTAPEPAAAKAAPAPQPAREASPGPRRPAHVRQPDRAEERRPAPAPVRITEERKADVRVGDEVVVTRGFLKGRAGVVHGIEEKGELKVAFGSLTARVPRADVEGRGPRAPQGDGGDRPRQRPRRG